MKNIAFLACSTTWWTNGIIAGDVFGTIDNVLVEMKDSGKYASTNNLGAICSTAHLGSKISNCVTKYVNYNENNAANCKNTASFIRFDKGATLSNNYTVYGGSDASEGSVTNAIGSAYNGKTYATTELVAIKPSEIATTTFTGLDTSIWTIIAGQLPKFTKSN